MRVAAMLLCAVWLAQAQPDGFAPAASCALCHARIGVVGQYPLWAGSMKAHAALDPYWKAQVAFEQSRHGAAAGEKCLRCHAPARSLAGEGVTCTVCHRIAAEELGSPSSFSGGFILNNVREIYGPHSRPFTMPMLRHTGYLAAEGRHMLEAALCGTCHTLETGTAERPFLEQAPYLEWLASAHPAEGRSCQSCHVPPLEGAQYIAHRPPGGPFPPTRPRQPFGRHLFAGGNTHVPRMLARELPEEAARLEGTARRAREMLAAAASLAGAATVDGDQLRVRVEIVNRTGHKLPTAYPSRRLWLHVRVTDAADGVVFESGRWDAAANEIAGIAGPQPHYRKIGRPGEVMIWEAEYAGASGRPTVSLLEAAAYVKDNRIPPRGFDLRRARGIAPVGVEGDGDFGPGSDAIEYEIDTRGRQGPFQVAVEACYQSIKPAFAKALGREFAELYRATGPEPVVIARAAFGSSSLQDQAERPGLAGMGKEQRSGQLRSAGIQGSGEAAAGAARWFDRTRQFAPHQVAGAPAHQASEPASVAGEAGADQFRVPDGAGNPAVRGDNEDHRDAAGQIGGPGAQQGRRRAAGRGHQGRHAEDLVGREQHEKRHRRPQRDVGDLEAGIGRRKRRGRAAQAPPAEQVQDSHGGGDGERKRPLRPSAEDPEKTPTRQ